MLRRALRALRIVLAAGAALGFLAGGPLIGLLLLPALRVVARNDEDYRRRCTRVLSRLHAFFVWSLRLTGLVRGPERYPQFPGIAPGEPYVLLSNHPTLIDAIFLLAGYRDLTCVVNRRWYRTLALGALLRRSAYLPGPRHDRGVDPREGVLGAMVRHLRDGHALLVFPEGERSLPGRIRRFRRGGVEAAVRARVPIVAVFLSTDRPFLTKTSSPWSVADGPARYSLELLEVIDTRAIPVTDARRLNAELQAKYEARYALALAAHAQSADRASTGVASGPDPRHDARPPATAPAAPVTAPPAPADARAGSS